MGPSHLFRFLVMHGLQQRQLTMEVLWKTSVVFLCVSVLSVSTEELHDANHDLTLQILDQLTRSNTGRNVVFSPQSILTGLSMLYVGTSGQTSRTMQRVLGLPSNDAKMKRQARKLLRSGRQNEASANMLVIEDEKGIKRDYADSLEDDFGAQPFRHSFSKTTQKTINTINDWISDNTNGKIRDLMPPSSVGQNTVLVLANALHFQANWSTPMEKGEREKFTLSNGRNVDVPMMQGDISIHHDEINFGRGTAEVFELPFTNPDYAMAIVLPSKNAGQSSRSSNNNIIPRIFRSNAPKKLARVKIPKFNLSHRSDMSRILRDLGLEDLFDPNRADFSKMADFSDGLYLQSVQHKATIDVNEAGVEAAAATGLSVSLYSLFIPDLNITIDRPFLFFIINKKTQMVLFAGRVENPNQT